MTHSPPPDVLLVEDNDLDVQLTLKGLALGPANWRLQVLKDGSEALDFLHRIGPFADRPTGEPRLILLDMKLPLVDGTYLLQQIFSNRRTRHIPLVVLSSSSDPADIFTAYKLGANSYLVKPLDTDQYIQAIRQMAVYWLSLNQPVVT